MISSSSACSITARRIKLRKGADSNQIDEKKKKREQNTMNSSKSLPPVKDHSCPKISVEQRLQKFPNQKEIPYYGCCEIPLIKYNFPSGQIKEIFDCEMRCKSFEKEESLLFS